MEISERHVLTVCPAVLGVRKETGLSTVMNSFRLNGLEEEEAYYYYVKGLDSKGRVINKVSYLERGQAMRKVISAWLSAW